MVGGEVPDCHHPLLWHQSLARQLAECWVKDPGEIDKIHQQVEVRLLEIGLEWPRIFSFWRFALL